MAPGVIRLCISADGGRTCRPDLSNLLKLAKGGGEDDIFAEPHFLYEARIVQPRPEEALLLLKVASVLSGDSDQRLVMVALAYDRKLDNFVPVYTAQTGHNNNQEIRYIEQDPLKGAIISANPTEDAPFGFWIVVNRPEGDGSYRQVLRYRSATHYNDGNPLAAIDSEMPNIQQRLGLWRPGSPLPLPAQPCPRPRLKQMELWCD